MITVLISRPLCQKFRSLEKDAFRKCVNTSKVNQQDFRIDAAEINLYNSDKCCHELLRDACGLHYTY